jgi:NADH-quinone oxidoreductase subunit M
MHTREIAKFGGLTNIMPRFALLFMIFTMGSVGLPATSGFVGEFLTFMGTWQVSYLATILATTGVVLGAVYMLCLYRNVMFGELKKGCEKMSDLHDREFLSLTILAALVIFLGIYPNMILEVTKAPVARIIEQVNR